MNLRSNAHCHTVYCDGKNTPEEMILAALERNFVSLGFSIHGWTPYEPTPVTMAREADYRAELRRLREKYAGLIEILIGAERDFLYERSFDRPLPVPRRRIPLHRLVGGAPDRERRAPLRRRLLRLLPRLLRAGGRAVRPLRRGVHRPHRPGEQVQ